MNLRPGERLSDQLQLERELGAGGMGSVWVAKHGPLGSLVAVKVLHPMRGPQATAQRARFEQEARGLARLDHPHLVKIYDFGLTDDGDPFIVMELLRGEDLAERIKRTGVVDLQETARIVAQTCNALTCAHAAGVIHRDIKPANIFLCSGVGADETFVKLVDFGVARFASAELGLTRTGDMIGTPYFMSPEQFLTPRSVDARSDLWSLGVVVYACVTGQLPFNGETLASLSVAVSSGRFRPPRSHRMELPPALDHFMSRALATDPAARYGSAAELAQAFLRAVSPDASMAFASTAFGGAITPSRPEAAPLAAQHPDWSPAPSLHAARSLAGAGPTRPSATRPSRSRARWLVPLIGASLVAVAASIALYVLHGARSVAQARSSASASADDAPPELDKQSLDELYERALREARKKGASVELMSLSYGSLGADGSLPAHGRAKYYFKTPDWRCINVTLTSDGVETVVYKCAKLATVPYPPRCSPAELRQRIRGKSPDLPLNAIYSQLTGASPQWSFNVGSTGGTLPDDCP